MSIYLYLYIYICLQKHQKYISFDSETCLLLTAPPSWFKEEIEHQWSFSCCGNIATRQELPQFIFRQKYCSGKGHTMWNS